MRGGVMPSRKAEAEWKGNLIQGGGRLAVESGAFEGPYTFKSRIEDGQSATNPEELLGAAHAGCFTMALTAELSRARFTPTRIHTGATVDAGEDRRRVRHHADRSGDGRGDSRHRRRDVPADCAG